MIECGHVSPGRANGDDPAAALHKSGRLFNFTVIFPPTLVSEFQVRLADWTPTIDLAQQTHPHLASGGRLDQFCPVYRMRAPQDSFGCKSTGAESSLRLPPELDDMMEQHGFVDQRVEKESPLFAMLLQEAFTRKISIEPRSLSVVKRGVCTFVDKARTLRSAGAALGLVVNSDNELLDMPAGKEKTADCSVPLGVARDSDGEAAASLCKCSG